jgi:hypothetical protein
MNHIDVIGQAFAFPAGIADGATSPKSEARAAQRQRIVSNSPVIMKANAIA